MKTRTSRFVLPLAIVGLGLTANAQASLITFEDLAGNTVGTTQVSTQYLASDGVTFSSTSNPNGPVLGDVGGTLQGWLYGTQIDTFAPGYGAANGSYFISDVNGLNTNGPPYTSNLTVTYTSPVDALSFDLIDIDFGETTT